MSQRVRCVATPSEFVRRAPVALQDAALACRRKAAFPAVGGRLPKRGSLRFRMSLVKAVTREQFVRAKFAGA